MNHQEMLRAAEEEISVRAHAIAKAPRLQGALEEYSEAHGYICCLYDQYIFNREQFNAAGDAISVAVDEVKKRIKKAAPGAGNTENGKNNQSILSITISTSNVKRGGDPGC
jgi:hypothetical protein